MNRYLQAAVLVLLFLPAIVRAQFAPQVPLAGNEGILYTSPLIKNWATGCTFYKGWLNIADKSLGQPTLGNEQSAQGPSDADVLSLGDSGVAVLTFPYAIKNGAGPDFAVYENGFPDPQHAEMAYLELAFVEVSSDGSHFVRFPATCNIQDTFQTDNFHYSEASLINNLAGKYISGYGTPFDLEELKTAPGLDVNHITHVRIVDVVGSIDSLYGSRDHNGRMINDPYPSVYPSGGFDLNAVAVLNSEQPTAIQQPDALKQLVCYPNPVKDVLFLEDAAGKALHYQLSDITGRILQEARFIKQTKLDMTSVPAGLYFLQLDNGTEKQTRKINKQ